MFAVSTIIIYIISFTDALRDAVFISDEDHNLLPQVYRMIDYYSCNKYHDIYVKADLRLIPINESDKIWQLIETTKRNKYLFDYDKIYRTVCVPKIYRNSTKDLKEFIRVHVEEEVRNMNLTAEVVKVFYRDHRRFATSDGIFYLIITGYLYLIAVATTCDVRKKINKGFARDILLPFSLRHNYRQILYKNKNKHYQNLKSVQGIRTITCISVITTHTVLSFLVSFVDDSRTLEDLHHGSVYFRYMTTSVFFITQIFSLISSWLLTIQVLSLHEKRKEFTIQDMFTLFINRIFRLLPTLVALLILLRCTILTNLLEGPLTDIIDSNKEACRKYWTRTVLFIQNYYYGADVCNEGYWFLSVDVQTYIICMLLLYASLKLNSMEKILKTSLILSCMLYGIVLYGANVDIIPRMIPEHFKWFTFLHNREMLFSYKMTHASLPTSILGMCFGVFYHRRHQTNENKSINGLLCVVSVFVLPLLAIVMSATEVRGFTAAILGPTTKLMFSFGVGIGILHLAQKKNGIANKILRNRLLEILSQFTYSTYVFHFIFVALRSTMYQPIQISAVTFWIKSFCQDIILGFLSGFIAYVTVELPWRQIQKRFLPDASAVEVKDKKLE